MPQPWGWRWKRQDDMTVGFLYIRQLNSGDSAAKKNWWLVLQGWWQREATEMLRLLSGSHTHTHKHVQLGSIQAYTNFCCLYALQSCWHALIIEIYAINVILHSDILPNKQLWKLSFLSLCPGHIFSTCTWFKYIWCYSSYHSSMQSFLSPLN